MSFELTFNDVSFFFYKTIYIVATTWYNKSRKEVNYTSKFKDLTGQKFGRLTTLYRLHNYHKKGTYWLCICECGNITEVKGSMLPNGHTKSCGCLNHESTNIKHGMTRTKLYKVWQGMKKRCYNKHYRQYNDYGGRGITICDEWLNDFQMFYDWAINNNYKDSLSIDRINNNKSYSPDNCRWTTRTQQTRNRRNTKYVTYQGKTKPLAEWCEILNLNYHTIKMRLYRGWSIEESFESKEGRK